MLKIYSYVGIWRNLRILLLFQSEKGDFERFLIGFGVSVKNIAGPRNQISVSRREKAYGKKTVSLFLSF